MRDRKLTAFGFIDRSKFLRAPYLAEAKKTAAGNRISENAAVTARLRSTLDQPVVNTAAR